MRLIQFGSNVSPACSRKYTKTLGMTVAVLCLMVFLLSGLSLQRSYNNRIETAKTSTENVTLLLLNQIGGTFDEVDRLLLALDGSLSHLDQSKRESQKFIEHQVRFHLAQHNELASIRIANLKGEIVYGLDGGKAPLGSDIFDRGYFQQHLNNKDLGLLISEPLQGKISGKWGLMFSRRLSHPDGSFAGVVAANVKLDYFANLFQVLKLGQKGSIALRDENLGVIYRHPNVGGNATIRSNVISSDFREALAANPTKGSYISRSTSIDGVSRVHTFRMHEKYHLYLNTGIALDEFLDDWLKEAKITLLIATLFSISLITIAVVLGRTFRKNEQANIELLNNEYRLRSLYESMSEGVAIHELVFDVDEQPIDYRLLEVNPAFELLTGLSRERVVGELASTAYGMQPPPFLEVYSRVASSGVAERFEQWFEPMGKAFSISVFSPAKNQFATVFEDITLRIQAQQEQERLSRSLRLLSQCNLALVKFESEEKLFEDICRLLVNAGGYVMAWVGIAQQDEKKTVLPVTHYGCDQDYLQKALISWDANQENGCGPTGLAIRTVTTQINADILSNPAMLPWREAALQQGYRSSIALPIIVDAKAMGAIMIYSPDANAFAEGETDLLEELVANVSFGIQAFYNRSKRRSAEAANTAKSAFLANMSHEIRTPLNAITGMAYILKRTELNTNQLDKLSKIENASLHLLEIINAILELSKIDAGKLLLEEREIRLDSILSNVVSMQQDQAAAKGLRFKVEPMPNVPPLLGDATRIQQCLLNYVSNAIKFTETGCITLKCEIEKACDDKVTIRFGVADTGIGIPADVISRLFNSFEQADNSTTRKYGGTGLGLAITKKLSELMGGEAGVKSEQGKGSEFWFSVQLRKSMEEAVAATPIEVVAEDELRSRYSGTRILLVEDDFINQEVAHSLLSDINFEIDIAADGREAVKKVAMNHYSVVLMDMQMPVMDGLEATRKIRAQSLGGNPPIIAMTANAYGEDRDRCLSAGMNDFVSKPANPQLLYLAILRALQNNS